MKGADAAAHGDLAPLNELTPARVWGMLESAPDGMLMTDVDGIILAVNQQVERLFGYDRVDLLGRTVDMLLPDRFRDEHRTHREAYAERPSTRAMGVGLELRARRNDGTEFPVEVSLSPLSDDDGIGVVASIRDVSARVNAAAHMARIQAAIDAVHDGVFMFEPDSLRFVYANDGATEQTGYSRAELLTMTPLDIKPEFTRSQFERLLEPLIAGEVDHVTFRTVHRRKSGANVPVEIVLEHRGGGDTSSNSLLVAIVRDVTQQVEVERQLSLSEETFRTSFDHAPVGMTLTRVDGEGRRIIERANSSLADMLGRSVDSLIGTNFGDITHPDEDGQDAEAAKQMADGTRDAYVTEKRYRRSDGSYFWSLLHASVVDRTAGTRSIAHLIDITDRRERQAERERLTTMEDRERIARDLHDLVIQRLFGAGMKLQAVIPEMKSTVAVERAHETIDELDGTIRELRSAIFSLHQQDHARSVRSMTDATIEAGAEMLGFRPDVTVVGAIESVPLAINTDLQATLREALSNAARHAGATAVRVRVDVADGELTLTVSDNGAGVSATPGIGSGLLNLRRRAEQRGGEFALSSPESGGTELTWTVPISL